MMKFQRNRLILQEDLSAGRPYGSLLLFNLLINR